MRKILIAVAALLLMACSAFAQGEIDITVVPELMRPGKTERLSFLSPVSGTARVTLCSTDDAELLSIRESMTVTEGANHLTWNGYYNQNSAVPPGNYKLCVAIGDERVYAALIVGEISPQIDSVQAPLTLNQYAAWPYTVVCSMAGRLNVDILFNGQWTSLYDGDARKGENALHWDSRIDGQPVPPDSYSIRVRLTDEEGFTGTAQQMTLAVLETITPPPAPTATPAPTARPYLPSGAAQTPNPNDYWTYPIPESVSASDYWENFPAYDEQEMWDMLMQPLTVISGDDQRETYKLRLTPDNSAKRDNIVGEITFESQGVHVLETRDDGWSLVEAYNSSYGPECTSRVGYGNTDERITGYVRTSLLKTVTPRTDYAIVIDKLVQRMYVFGSGKLIGSLLISTGEPTSKQPWNETPAGEFVMCSRTGDFNAGNLVCRYGMRVNGGCLIHEVPYIESSSGHYDYSSTVPMLGKKASHGCIRVQKAKTEEGLNIKWLWDNIRVPTKIIIWDDTGRTLKYLDENMPMYYNKDGGKNFHTNQYCPAVKDRYLPLTEITYGDLSTSFKKLTACNTCATSIMTKAEIDAINATNNP